MLLTIIEDYPSEERKYANTFVHARVKNYIKAGIRSEVFLLKKDIRQNYVYTFEGVKVHVGNCDYFNKFYNLNKIDSIFAHFFSHNIIKALKNVDNRCKLVIFVHGNEALLWYQRLFKDRINSPLYFLKFIKYIIMNTINMRLIRKYFKNTNRNITIVGVSNWMLNQTVNNWKLNNLLNIKLKVIPNIVDENVFQFYEKNENQRFNVLVIKNFENGKYACDIIQNVILKMSKLSNFSDFNFLIVGSGRLFNKYTRKIKNFSNIKMINRFLKQSEIADIHKKFGILLCPTRQDAQGVSMCEAMSSGLIPISSNNTAIPEFLPAEFGLSCNNEEEMINKIISISEDPNMFTIYSKGVSDFIKNKCNKEATVDQEILLINNN